ncbi:NUDIX hydrolase [Candidatus Berkelbacteria bacterium]|nr:NUDIX hydrolase [Candidatus Berkelbacteria bacterium]
MKRINLAGCIITDDQGRLLLIHRQANDEWELPGGRLDQDEPADIGAARQMFEELGIDVEIKTQMGSTEFNQNGQSYNFSWFKADLIEGQPQPRLQSEADSLRYFSKKEVLELPNRSAILEQIVNDLK